MPSRTRSRKMRGGFLGFGESNNQYGNTNSGWSWSSLNPFKKSDTQSSSYVPQQSSYYPQGGKKQRSKRRHMKGGFSSNVSRMNAASSAAPISGIKNAQPQVWVGKGGRTRRTRRHRKH